MPRESNLNGRYFPLHKSIGTDYVRPGGLPNKGGKKRGLCKEWRELLGIPWHDKTLQKVRREKKGGAREGGG